MWLDFRRMEPFEELFLAALGRSVALAQNFEATCKFVLMTIELGKAFETRRLTTLEDAHPFVERLLQHMLGETVRRVGEIGEIGTSDVATLRSAKDARNYIVHEATWPVTRSGVARELTGRIAALRLQVETLAQGDALVSRWSYAIQEKEPAPSAWAKEYPAAVAAWVLEPIDSLTLRSSRGRPDASNCRS